MSKYGHLTHNYFEDLMNRMGGEDGADRFKRGELVLTVPDPARARWTEHDGVISFKVTSDGTIGPKWIDRLEREKCRLGHGIKNVLNSPHFTPGESGTIYHVRVLRGMLWEDKDRTMRNIRAEATRRGLIAPHPEVACLIRLTFSDKDLEAMGLHWLVTMHEPVKDTNHELRLLGSDRAGWWRWFSAYYVGPNPINWRRRDGFAFVFSPSGTS